MVGTYVRWGGGLCQGASVRWAFVLGDSCPFPLVIQARRPLCNTPQSSSAADEKTAVTMLFTSAVKRRSSWFMSTRPDLLVNCHTDSALNF